MFIYVSCAYVSLNCGCAILCHYVGSVVFDYPVVKLCLPTVVLDLVASDYNVISCVGLYASVVLDYKVVSWNYIISL